MSKRNSSEGGNIEPSKIPDTKDTPPQAPNDPFQVLA